MPAFSAIVPAAGFGTRVGANKNKIFLEIDNQSIIERTVQALHESQIFKTIVIVAREEETWQLREQLSSFKDIHFCIGGKTRQDSVFSGLEYLKNLAFSTDYVLIHDAARCFITSEYIQELCSAIESDSCARTAAIQVSDTLCKQDIKGEYGEIVPREGLWRIQTPQVFSFKELFHAHQKASLDKWQATDDASLVVQMGGCVRFVESSDSNKKVTVSSDLLVPSS